jgi:hypothetical protein
MGIGRDLLTRGMRTCGGSERSEKRHGKEETGYHRRSLVETTMFRLKTIFTDRISARTNANQCVQLFIRCKLLNRMTALGMPDSCLAAWISHKTGGSYSVRELFNKANHYR